MSELVSIIVPIYKVERYLEHCIHSITNQSYKRLDIILIDDGSPDSCSAACDECALRDDRTMVIHKSNGGLSDARNVGIDVLQGKYVTFIDSDDWIESKYVEKMLDAALTENADIIACSYVDEYEQSGRSKSTQKEYFSGNTEQALALLYDQTRIAAAAMKFYRREIWENIRFPIGKIYEDALTTYKIFDKADKIVQIPDGLYHYRIREGSIMTSSFSLETIGRVDAWEENYLFCRERYPMVAPLAHLFWLEHIPKVISQFPKDMTEIEKAEKARLKRCIKDNMLFILTHMPAKKIYHQVRALCFQ